MYKVSPNLGIKGLFGEILVYIKPTTIEIGSCITQHNPLTIFFYSIALKPITIRWIRTGS